MSKFARVFLALDTLLLAGAAAGVGDCGASVGWRATIVAGGAGQAVGVASAGEAKGDTSDVREPCVGEAPMETPGMAVSPRHWSACTILHGRPRDLPWRATPCTWPMVSPD